MSTLIIPPTRIWAVIDPDELSRQWSTLPEKITSGLGDTGTPIVHDGIELRWVLFPASQLYTLGVLVSELTLEHPLSIFALVPACATARAKVIYALKGLGVQKAEEHVQLFPL